ncbi:chitobiase/beta-hexosaminidase C-terminal domain-containing protein [Myceligenerans crystallogenes]|uniref:F5/8 type C domain-containing protein n=1 Tax=Myceligenerans crystallogenes TaxID=316335 RepID=A0ABN2NL17_9MICO
MDDLQRGRFAGRRVAALLTIVLATAGLPLATGAAQALPGATAGQTAQASYAEQGEVPVIGTNIGTVPSLPDRVAVRGDDGSDHQVPVDWEAVTAGQFTEQFTKVEVRGTATGADGSLAVYADVWVLPANLVYLIDAGRASTTSDVFDAARALRGESLVNAVPDRQSTAADQWGYVQRNETDVRRVSTTAGTGEDWATSFVADDNDADEGIVYRLPLDTGTYRVTVVHVPRRTQTHGSWINQDGEKIDSKTVAVSRSSDGVHPPVLVTHEIVVERPTVISYEAQKLQEIGGYNASLSLVAVEQRSTSALSPPVIEPLSGRLTFAGSATVTLSSTTSGGDVYYTTDGTTPSADNGTPYTKPFTLLESATVRAVTVAEDGTSAESRSEFTIVPDPRPYESVPVGRQWYDDRGRHIQAHGGGFLRHDGWYYWVGENKEHHSSSFRSVNLYRSKDLLNWEFVNEILTGDSATGDDAPRLAEGKVKVERPKLLYNEKTRKFVLWGHWELAENYSSARIVVATSDTIDGLYEYVDDFRPGEGVVWDKKQRAEIDATVANGQYASFEEAEAAYRAAGNVPHGHQSHDFTVYQEPDSADAYLISSEGHYNQRIYPLSGDYLMADHERSYPIFTGETREAPAVVKADGRYYLFTSGQSGWYSNQLMYAHTTDLSSPDGWSRTITLGNNTGFKSQPTWIMDIPRSDGGHSYVYMGDRWIPAGGMPDSPGHANSTYVWLPLEIGDDPDAVSMEYTDGWSLDVETGEVVVPRLDLVSEGKPVTSTGGTASSGYTDPASVGYVDDPEVRENPARAANDGIDHSVAPYDNSHYFKPTALPLTWQVDLEEVRDLARVDISWRSYKGSETYPGYRVSGSVDGENWDVLADRADNRTVGFTSDGLEGRYRHVRLEFLSNAGDRNGSSATWAAGLVEVQVHARPYATAAALCTGGRAFVTVTVENPRPRPATFLVSTEFGSRRVSLGTGRSQSVLFSARSRSAEPGVATVEILDRPESEAARAPYDGVDCR